MNEHIHAQNLGDAILLGPEHLDEDTIVFLADGSLEGEPKLAADAHLAACDDCSYLVDDLRSFRAVTEPERWENIVQHRRRSRAPLFGLAAAACLAGVIAVGVLRNDPTPTAVATATTASTATSATVATERQVAGSRTTMSLRDGNQQIALHADGSVSGVGARHAELVRTALTSRTLPEAPYLAELATVASTLRGASGEAQLALLEPVAAVVSDARPTFRWTAVEGATAYRVSVHTNDFNPVLESAPLTTTSWTPERDLPRGKTLTWQVAAQVGSDEVIAPGTAGSDAKFHVLSATASDEIRGLSRERSHLVRGLVYARHGLLRDAEAELQQVASSNAGSPAAQSLLAAVREKLPPITPAPAGELGSGRKPKVKMQ